MNVRIYPLYILIFCVSTTSSARASLRSGCRRAVRYGCSLRLDYYTYNSNNINIIIYLYYETE